MWQNLVWLSGTDACNDTHCKGCHMVVRKRTHMTLIGTVYSAVVVVMMKIVHKIGESIYQGQV